MAHRAALATITATLLDEQTGSDRLTTTLEDYRELLLAASGLELGGHGSMDGIRTHGGIAIGTTWAALCLDDAWRTKRFVSGLHQAVTDLLARRPGPVHVLYAGTGPWATLFLPLTTCFSPAELRVTALEINPVSVVSVARTFASLGLEDYLVEIIEADAAEHRITGERPVDLLLSETMQHTLVSEMQVPIVLNLLGQLPEGTVLVPAAIRLHLGVMDDYACGRIERELGEVFVFDPALVRSLTPAPPPLKNSSLALRAAPRFPTVRRLVPPPPPAAHVGPLALLTTIRVYGTHELTHYESVLTYPQVIADYPSEDNPLEAIDFTYRLEPEPELGMEFLVTVAPRVFP